MSKLSIIIQSVGAIVLVFANPGHSLIFSEPSSFDPNRFTGFPADPAPNPSFIHAGVNLTGVGFRVGGEARAVTLISPKHFLYARHYTLGSTTPLWFVAADGTVVERFVAQNHAIFNDAGEATDLMLGELDVPIPESSGVTCQPYLNNPGLLTEEQFYHSPPYNELIVIGREARGGSQLAGNRNYLTGEYYSSGINDFQSAGGFNSMRIFQFDYVVGSTSGADCRYQSGDSGGPTLVNVEGTGAIVGIHSFYQTYTMDDVPILYRNSGPFVGHPDYVRQIDAIMEDDGYHFSKAFPGQGELDLEVSAPERQVRAGQPVELVLKVLNPSAAATNNLKLQFPLSGVTGATILAAGWVETSTATLFDLRRGGLESGEITSATVSAIFQTPGEIALPVSLNFDEGPETKEILHFKVVESFTTFTAGLEDPTSGGDSDGDFIPNLLEYACKGDVREASMTLSDGVTPILPGIVKTPSDENLVCYRYLRRTDAKERALEYLPQVSPSMTQPAWTTETPVKETITDLGIGLEEVCVFYPEPEAEMFFRLKVNLNE